ncbi:hypothetical protein CASFOL_042993 [Castilleja foliolosa]|uniref:Uncharacterized protein n=1 Tax=Castilleja foliolosa TaxID=1961234 RepID=A0ABD3B7K5_9LAMI
MEPDNKVKIIERAIRKLMEEEEEEEEVNAKTSSSSDNENLHSRRRQELLSDLLSKLESMEEKVNNVTEMDEEDNEEEIIIKELRHIKRQNTTTHWLVSAMIVFTLAWQLSEISLIMKIKNGFTNPLKSIGGAIGGFIKNRGQHVTNVQDMIKEIPEVPNLGLPGFDDEHNDEDQLV